MSGATFKKVTAAQCERLSMILAARRVLLEGAFDRALKDGDSECSAYSREKTNVVALERVLDGIFGGFYVVVPPEGMSAQEFEQRLQFLFAEWDYERE